MSQPTIFDYLQRAEQPQTAGTIYDQPIMGPLFRWGGWPQVERTEDPWTRDRKQGRLWEQAQGSPWNTREQLGPIQSKVADFLESPGGSALMMMANFIGPGFKPGMRPPVPAARTPAGALPMDLVSRMARAKEQGYRLSPVFHGTSASNGDIFTAFDPARVGGRTSGSQAGTQGVSVALTPEVANEFAFLAAQKSGGNPAVMPLLHRTERPAAMRLDGTERNLEVAATLSDAFGLGHDAVALRNYTTPSGSGGHTAVVVRNPNQLRSVNAAFDPARRHEADLMASRLLPPFGAGLAAALFGRDEQ